jgi:hypothetical protein
MIHMVHELMSYVCCHDIFHCWFDALIMTMYATDLDMSPRKKTTSIIPLKKSSRSGSWQEEEPNVLGVVYNDTTTLLDKGGTLLKWGEAFQMFKRQDHMRSKYSKILCLCSNFPLCKHDLMDPQAHGPRQPIDT